MICSAACVNRFPPDGSGRVLFWFPVFVKENGFSFSSVCFTVLLFAEGTYLPPFGNDFPAHDAMIFHAYFLAFSAPPIFTGGFLSPGFQPAFRRSWSISFRPFCVQHMMM